MATLTQNPTTDGWAGVQGSSASFATHRAASGTIHRDEDDGDNESIALRCDTTNFDLFRRAMFSVDTSSIPDTDTVTAATLRLYVNSKTETLAGQELTVCNGGPSSDSALANSDFEGNVSNTTAYSSPLALASITASAYNEWTFNAAGLAAINKTGYTKFQLRFESDRANSAPTCSGTNGAIVNWNFNNAASNKSELVVTHVESTGVPRTTTFFL